MNYNTYQDKEWSWQAIRIVKTGLSVLLRIIEWIGLEGTLKTVWFRFPCCEQRSLFSSSFYGVSGQLSNEAIHSTLEIYGTDESLLLLIC